MPPFVYVCAALVIASIVAVTLEAAVLLATGAIVKVIIALFEVARCMARLFR